MALAPDGIIVMHKALHPSSLIPAGFAMVWDAECPEAALAFHDKGEIARAAL